MTNEEKRRPTRSRERLEIGGPDLGSKPRLRIRKTPMSHVQKRGEMRWILEGPNPLAVASTDVKVIEYFYDSKFPLVRGL